MGSFKMGAVRSVGIIASILLTVSIVTASAAAQPCSSSERIPKSLYKPPYKRTDSGSDLSQCSQRMTPPFSSASPLSAAIPDRDSASDLPDLALFTPFQRRSTNIGSPVDQPAGNLVAIPLPFVMPEEFTGESFGNDFESDTPASAAADRRALSPETAGTEVSAFPDASADDAQSGNTYPGIATPGSATPGNATPGNAPSGSPPSSRPSLEREFLKNVLRDQRAIWTAPLHFHRDQAYFLLPLAGVTTALFVTDRYTAEDGGEFSAASNHQKISDTISSVGAIYIPAGLAGSLYVVGRLTGNDKARETAVLAAEAVVDSTIVGQGMKLIFNRPRPSSGNGEGEFWGGGSSFPSGHSLEVWSIATVVANEYSNHLWVEIGAYSMASLVSASRFTGHHHFLSDILIGSAIGYGIGRYVYRAHHYPPGGPEPGSHHILSRLRSHLMFVPIYDPAIRAYGGSLAYSFGL